MDRYLPKLSEGGRRWARFFALLVGIALLAWIAMVLRPVLTPIVAALALAYILNPLITWLEKKYRISRAISISIGLAVLLAAGAALLVAGTAQIIQLAGDAPDYTQKAIRWLDQTIPGLVSNTPDASPTPARPEGADQTDVPPLGATNPAATGEEAAAPPGGPELSPLGRERLLELVAQHGVSVGRAVIGYIAGVVSNVFYWLSLTLLLPLYTFFFLLRFNELVQTVRDHLPSAYRPTVVRIVTTIDAAISTFFRGRLLVCLAVGTLMGVGWWIVEVPYNLALGALAGILNLVPFLSVLALPPALILTYSHAVDVGANWVGAVSLVLAVYLVVQAIESFVLTPVIESKASGLHPITTVIVLLVGGQLAGLLGMLLAIPITSTLKSLVAEYALPEVRRLAADQPIKAAEAVDAAADSSQRPPAGGPATTADRALPGDVSPQDRP
jgi:predicted PurR-regulated permease PerM